ncbi:hypothetical protein [Mycolicibacterium sp.]|uniref:hypothetical protein n=1 Tax=Mycolicibacterium sp. TaxID=2320850 RepID=UPI003560CA2B
MGRPVRRSRRRAILTHPKALAAELPEPLRNPNGVGGWEDRDEHRQAVADYLRTAGVSPAAVDELVPSVAAATGIPFCLALRDRLNITSGRPTAATDEHTTTES